MWATPPIVIHHHIISCYPPQERNKPQYAQTNYNTIPTHNLAGVYIELACIQ